MNKFVPLLLFLLSIPIIANESFAYFGGDMIEKNSLSFNFDKIQETSDIITINQLDNDESSKRYIVFGHGSVTDIDFLTNGISTLFHLLVGFFQL